jgi:hypothetical protein
MNRKEEPMAVTMDEVMAQLDAREAQEDAMLPPVRFLVRLWRSRHVRWQMLTRPRPWQRVRYRWQRSKRGWADCDVWSLDSYIARVLSEAVPRLAEGHAYPGREPWETPEKWAQYVRDLGARLGTWNDDTWVDDAAFETTRAAMEEFGHEFGVFWD